MANRDKVLAALKTAVLCDDCIAKEIGVPHRQSPRAACLNLVSANMLYRARGMCSQCGKTKFVSSTSPIDSHLQNASLSGQTGMPVTPILDKIDHPWYWEGNIQGLTVTYLVKHGYRIQSVANTTSHETGKDIIALGPDGSTLWISVKGYPEKSVHTQARHWFSGAIFDLVLYHGENVNVNLAIALPAGFATYANLAPRIRWLKDAMSFKLLWVNQEGNVRVE